MWELALWERQRFALPVGTRSKIPSPNLDAVQTRCLLSVSPNVYEEAVWMVGVVVGLAGKRPGR